MDDNMLQKKRTKNTALTIISKAQANNVDSLITDIFVHTDNSIAYELIKRYEKQLVLAFVEPEKFKTSLHLFYKEMNSFINKNKLHKEFLSFFYFVTSSISIKEESNKLSLYMYFDLLSQQMCYFLPIPYLVCGINNKGKWMMKKEPYPYLDVAILEESATVMKTGSFSSMSKAFKRYGYDVKNPEDYVYLDVNDQLMTNNIIFMANFISEDTKEFLCDNYHLFAEGFALPKEKIDVNIFKGFLKNRRYMLPLKGVIGEYKNSGEIKSIYFREVFRDNRIFLLYKIITTKDRELSGVYDNKIGFFYSTFLGTTDEILHPRLENFILESYAYLVTNIELNEDQIRLMVVTDYDSKIDSPMVIFSINESTERNKGSTARLFDKKKYKESLISINPQIRKLPLGWTASDEAKEIAKEYGYILGEGETFVKPFEKKIYRNSDT